jgi:predicted dehydrogenase
MSAVKLRVGILGTGRMARDFATGLAAFDDAVIQAIGSRTLESARRFAAEFAAPDAHEGYDALATNADVDLVYIATPHSEHAHLSLMCLDHGKPVLCEKPFAINEAEARAVLERSLERQLFVAEAMWSRHLPAYVRLQQLLDEGAIGTVQLMLAGGAFMPAYDPDFYLFDPALGGGVMLDAGVYLVSLASMVFGTPQAVKAAGSISEHGVDEHDAVILEHANGALAMLYVSLRAQQMPDLTLFGDRGKIHVHGPIFAPQRLTLSVHGEAELDLDLPFEGNGYHYQVADAARCIADGRIESAVMPHAETLSIMQTMDEFRRQIGLQYPMEN